MYVCIFGNKSHFFVSLLLSFCLSHQYFRLNISKVRKIIPFSTLPQAPSLSLFLMSLFLLIHQSQFTRVAITKYHKLDGLHNRNSFSHSSGSWTTRIKMLAVLLPYEASLLGLQTAALLLPFHVVVPLYVHAKREIRCLFLFSYEHQSYQVRFPHL